MIVRDVGGYFEPLEHNSGADTTKTQNTKVEHFLTIL